MGFSMGPVRTILDPLKYLITQMWLNIDRMYKTTRDMSKNIQGCQDLRKNLPTAPQPRRLRRLMESGFWELKRRLFVLEVQNQKPH